MAKYDRNLDYNISLTRNYGDVDVLNKLNKKKKKEYEVIMPNPERLDPKVKRSKSELKVHRALESEKENVLIETTMKSSFSVNDANGEAPGVKIDRARITRSFSQVMGRDEKGNLCRICGRPVFLMDRIKAEKSVFHKGCFRCKECNKQLTVDSYSSHEGVLHCKLHFKQLFQPKVKFEEEGPIIPRRRHEMIIKENTPLELPPDVIRSSDKPDYGLTELPSLRNIKSRFEESDESDLANAPSQVAIKRSESILSKMAKFQSSNSENGHYEDSSSDDEATQDPDVIRETRKKEKLQMHLQENSEEVAFTGMTDLKTQWEAGSVKSKEEWTRETQEELNKLRQRICQGKGNLRAVYETALQEAEKSVSKDSSIELEIRELCSIKEKWEKNEVLSEAEQDKLEKFNKDREDDLSVFKDSGAPAEARTMFKKIDETVIKTGTPIPVKKSPSLERSRSSREIFFSNMAPAANDIDIVKCNEKNEDVSIDPVEIHQKFKFFENYQDQKVNERKRFTMTPPREVAKEDSAEREISRDPNIIRACDQEVDIPVTDTAKKMLNKFRELETQTEREEVSPGPKPMKRITPPREYTTNSYPPTSDHESSPEPERDPNIVRCSDKIEDTIFIEAEKTRSLRAKFEHWEGNDIEAENQKNGIDNEEIYPSLDTTKNLKAKFEALKEDNKQSGERPKNKVNRFVDNVASMNTEYCAVCEKRVYAMEKMEANGMKFHRACFKCSMCSCVLRLDNYTTSEGIMYCTPHFKQLFISRGNYDEGFGREQHKEKWNRSRSTTPTPKEFNGLNGNGEYYCSETEEMMA